MAFLAWSLIHVFWTESPWSESVAGFAKTAIYALLYWVGRHVVDGDATFARLAKHIAAIALVTGLYGFWQVLTGLAPFELAWIASGFSVLTSPDGSTVNTSLTLAGTTILRPFSTFSGPFYFADFIVIALLLLIARGPARSVARLAFFAFLIVMLAATLVRTGWACLLIALLIYRLMLPGVSRVAAIGSFVAIAGIAVMLAGTIGSDASSPLAIAASPATFLSRVNEWQILISGLVPQDIIGHGFGVRDVGTFAIGGPSVRIGHSMVFEIIGDLGIVGVALVGAAVIVTIRMVRGMVAAGGPDSPRLVLAFAAIPAALALAHVFGGGFWTAEFPDELFFWLGLGLSTGALNGWLARKPGLLLDAALGSNSAARVVC
jgi:hypothetical protein